MFMQFYDSLPNFIEEWTNSSDLVATLGLHEGQLARMTPRGLQVPQEWMCNLDAGIILLLMVPAAWLFSKMNRLTALILGVGVTCVGLLLFGTVTAGWSCLLGIGVFALGEMMAAPKVNEYLGVIAPKGEEALYMGYANIPFAFGWACGSKIAGMLYDSTADKANLAIRWLHEHSAAGDVARTDAMKRLQEVTGLDPAAATDLLWRSYHPYTFWYGFVAVGLASAVGMVLFSRAVKRKET
jgi:hypothetical protein